MRRNRPVSAVVTAALITVLLTACGGLPKEVKKRADAVGGSITAMEQTIAKNRDRYAQFIRSGEFQPFARYAEKEDWAASFGRAKAELARARALYNSDLMPLVKKNDRNQAPAVIQQVNRIDTLIENSRKISLSPFNRFDELKTAAENADDIDRKTAALASEVSRAVSGLAQGPVKKAKTDFPDAVQQIDARMAPFLKFDRETQQAARTVHAQCESHRTGRDTDYAALADNAAFIDKTAKAALEKDAVFRKELDELYSSYTKILQDMKAEYEVTVARESWNENSDYYNPSVMAFKRRVDADLFEYLDGLAVENIAQIDPGIYKSSFKSHIGSQWNDLTLDPAENWPGGGHNAAVFWIEQVSEKYFHKYLIEENGEQKETDWVPVSADLYENNLDMLGMAVLTKPYGVFESDRLTQAAPPGMAYVGNPRYGEWQKDSNGDRFWSWYGKYAFFSSLFFLPPFYYSYHSWDRWNRGFKHKKPYFGEGGNSGTRFGTAGTFVRKSPRFMASSFAKSGGLKAQAPSVRGAGAAIRGGGPKSKGK